MGIPVMTAEEIIGEKGGEVHSVSADTTIHEALTTMVDHRVGSVLVKEGSRIVGIWTERDLMRNSIDRQFDPKTTSIGDYMTRGVKFAPHTDSAYALMDKFLGLRLRHLLIDKDGEFIGLLSVGDVMKTALHEKNREFEELHNTTTWAYYEEWRQGRARKGMVTHVA